MRLFKNDIKRVDRYAKPSEPHYKYLCVSARPEYVATCEKLEEWFENYPHKEKKEFIKRFQTDKDDQFLAAFYELYLFELLRKIGYDIEIHPEIIGCSYKPDFLVKSQDGEDFYLEIITVIGKSKEEVAREKLLNMIYDVVEEVENNEFFLRVKATSFPKKAIPAKKIKQFLERELKHLNPDKCIEMINQNRIDLLPQWEFDYRGFSIEIGVLPRSKEFRSKINLQPIAMRTDPHWSDRNQETLIASLRNKANKFGVLDRPFIIAANMAEGYFDRNFFDNALFGYQKDILSNGDLLIDALKDQVTGFWYSNGKCRHTRVSGIMITKQLFPWTVGVTDIHLYHNPWSRHSYSGRLNLFPHSEVEDNVYIKREGIQPVKLLNLPEKWPFCLAKEFY